MLLTDNGFLPIPPRYSFCLTVGNCRGLLAVLESGAYLVVFENWIIILMFTIFGLLWNLICIAYFAYFIFDDYWFEKSLIEFGNSTGVVASGLLLLRLADPKNISKTLPIFTSKQLFAQLILSGGLFTVLAPLMISKIGLDYWTEICALITLAILFIALIFNKVEMKKFS